MEPEIAEQVSPEQTTAAQPAVVQTETKTSQPDIETRLRETEDRLRREHQEELANLRTQFEEEQRRTRQSFRDTGDSIVKRVNDRLSAVSGPLDELVKDGLLTQEEVNNRKQNLRFQIEHDELRREEEERTRSRQAILQEDTQRVLNTCNGLLKNSGLVQTDPEWNDLPLDLNGLQSDDAIKKFRGAVEQAQAKKKAREERAKKAKEQEEQAKLKKAQEAAPYVDLGGGGAKPPLSDEEQLEELNRQGPPSDARGITKYQKQLKELRKKVYGSKG